MKIPQAEQLNGSQADITVDASGLHCPMPLLKAKQALNRMEIGEVLYLVATDSGSWKDLHSFVELAQHELLAAKQEQNHYTYWIKKSK